MRKSCVWVFAFVAAASAAAAPLRAQEAGVPDRRAEAIRQQIEDRLAGRVQEELGLTDAQIAKLRATSADWAGQRRGLEARERLLRSSLARQLRPGVAGDQDSVARLTDDLLNLKVKYAQTFRDEMKDLSHFLNPVQRAQFFVIRERLLQRVQEIRERRQAAQLGSEGDTAPLPRGRGRQRP
jgi:Spy/CpxP family protein refolding chaperone